MFQLGRVIQWSPVSTKKVEPHTKSAMVNEDSLY